MFTALFKEAKFFYRSVVRLVYLCVSAILVPDLLPDKNELEESYSGGEYSEVNHLNSKWAKDSFFKNNMFMHILFLPGSNQSRSVWEHNRHK